MRNTISTFISNCRDFFQREQNKSDEPAQASFERSFNSSLKYVGKNKESIARDFTVDWECEKARWRASDIYETLEKQRIVSRNSIPHEMDRRQRAEQLIEMGKSHKPLAVAQSRQMDEPDLEPQ